MKIDLWHGDCLELMKNIPDGSIDMVLADIPYGTTKCRWDQVIPFEPMWEQLKRIIKPNGAICLFGSEPFSSALRMSNLKWFKYDWVWRKNKHSNFYNNKTQPRKFHELISVFYKSAPTYNPQLEPFSDAFLKRSQRKKSFGEYKSAHHGKKNVTSVERISEKGAQPKSVIDFKLEQNNQHKKAVFHPTQKPVALLEYLIKTYTLEGETVLDFTMGSGSTGVAAVNLNRNFIGIELDQTYFEIAQKRINEA